MPYFDPTEPFDLALLPEGLREHDDLGLVTSQAESDVLARYTEDGVHVALTGYADGPAEADGYDPNRSLWTGLPRALRLAVALVVAHRLRYGAREEGVASERRGGRSVTYSAGLSTRWPKGWDAFLAPFDEREPLFRF